MNFTNRNGHAREKKLSEQFVEFIDLADENLEEIDISELGYVRGGGGNSGGSGKSPHGRFPGGGGVFGDGCASVLAVAPGFALSSCGFGSCDFGSCSFSSCGFGGFGSCVVGSCGSCAIGVLGVFMAN